MIDFLLWSDKLLLFFEVNIWVFVMLVGVFDFWSKYCLYSARSSGVSVHWELGSKFV